MTVTSCRGRDRPMSSGRGLSPGKADLVPQLLLLLSLCLSSCQASSSPGTQGAPGGQQKALCLLLTATTYWASHVSFFRLGFSSVWSLHKKSQNSLLRIPASRSHPGWALGERPHPIHPHLVQGSQPRIFHLLLFIDAGSRPGPCGSELGFLQPHIPHGPLPPECRSKGWGLWEAQPLYRVCLGLRCLGFVAWSGLELALSLDLPRGARKSCSFKEHRAQDTSRMGALRALGSNSLRWSGEKREDQGSVWERGSGSCPLPGPPALTLVSSAAHQGKSKYKAHLFWLWDAGFQLESRVGWEANENLGHRQSHQGLACG